MVKTFCEYVERRTLQTNRPERIPVFMYPYVGGVSVQLYSPTAYVRLFWFVFSAPSSPVHNRRLLTARNMRMSSVELPDDNDKSLSSASTSPCPSPVRHPQVQYIKPQRACKKKKKKKKRP